MSVEVTEATKVFRTTYFLEINNLMARIILFCFFEEKKRIIKFQMKFFHPSELRLRRTGMLLLTKSKGHKPNGVELGTSV